MPKGIAYLFSKLSTTELFGYIEKFFNQMEIKLEIPGTNRIQMWNTNGDMVQIDKKNLNKILPEINNYLIQFWWPQMDDVSIKLINEESVCECDIYLDGLNELQFYDIFNLLFSITINIEKTLGFILDKKEIASEIGWKKLFLNIADEYSYFIRELGLRVKSEYEITNNHLKPIIDLDQNKLYVAIKNYKSNKINLLYK